MGCRADFCARGSWRLTARSATGASRRWRSIWLWPNRLAPVGWTALFADRDAVRLTKQVIFPIRRLHKNLISAFVPLLHLNHLPINGTDADSPAAIWVGELWVTRNAFPGANRKNPTPRVGDGEEKSPARVKTHCY